MAIKLLGNVTPIHLLGESHSLAFKDMIFQPDWSDETFVCRNRFAPRLLASQYTNGGAMGIPLAEMLQAQGLLDGALRPAHIYADPSAAFIAGTPLAAPPIVFFGCDTNLVFLIEKFGLQYDFELPDDTGYGTDLNKQPIPYVDVLRQVQSIVEPFIRGIQMLRDVQFSRIMVHCLPPRNPDEDAACCFTGGVKIPRTVRSKMVLLTNRLLRAACEKGGIGYIDIWPETTADGYLRPEFVLDGIHVNRRAALISLEKIAEHLFDHTHDTHNVARYTDLLGRAERYLSPHTLNSTDSIWVATGVVNKDLGNDFVEKVLEELTFLMADTNPHARTDWVGANRKGLPNVRIAKPCNSVLQIALSTFQNEDSTTLIHAGSSTAMTVVSFRPVEFCAINGSVMLNASPSFPPGVRCGVLQLTQDAVISFESIDGNPIDISTAKGHVAIYDPKRVRCICSPATDSVKLVEIVLIPRLPGQPFRVQWSGLENWPVDPYQHSVSGMDAFPPHVVESFSARAM